MSEKYNFNIFCTANRTGIEKLWLKNHKKSRKYQKFKENNNSTYAKLHFKTVIMIFQHKIGITIH